jgi:two-component system, OmpR family, phosphate regulon sensor histidine kinase PhoR
MPPINSWLVITIRTPFLIVVFAIPILIGLITLTVFTFRQKSRQVKTLMFRVEEQNAEIELTKKQEASVSPAQQAYLQFTYNISHEVSNPLQSVQINLENMEDCSPEETVRRKQYYEIIKQEIKRLFTLTENLRLLSHLERTGEPIKREPVNLKSVIEDVIMAQAERASKKNIILKYQGPNRPAKVLGNRGYLYQMIINLVDNSIKYSKDLGGEIVINLAEESNCMLISISDDGIGIPQEDLPFVFDTAYRSPNKGSIIRTGSGLGLAIVKRIVDQHEGKVRINSVLGEGTTLTIDLPIYNPSTEE